SKCGFELLVLVRDVNRAPRHEIARQHARHPVFELHAAAGTDARDLVDFLRIEAAFLPNTSASAIATVAIWPSMLLISFIANPCPSPPTWNTFLPIARNRSSLAAKVSARPPTITDRVAAAAPCVPPLTGASSMVTPLA